MPSPGISVTGWPCRIRLLPHAASSLLSAAMLPSRCARGLAGRTIVPPRRLLPAALVFAWCHAPYLRPRRHRTPRGVAAPPSSASRRTRGIPRLGIDNIEHVIFIVQENRSFDKYSGRSPGRTACANKQGIHSCVRTVGRMDVRTTTRNVRPWGSAQRACLAASRGSREDGGAVVALR